jgi:hypothetical protein
VFRFSPNILAQLGWATDPVTLVIVLEGTGSDVGFLQIVADPRGYAVTGSKTKAGQSRNITVGVDRFNHYVLNEPGPIPTAPVSFVLENGYMLIECPDWLKFNPLSVPQPEPVVAPEPTRVVSRDEQFADLMADVKPMPKATPRLVASNSMRSDAKMKRPYKR